MEIPTCYIGQLLQMILARRGLDSCTLQAELLRAAPAIVTNCKNRRERSFDLWAKHHADRATACSGQRCCTGGGFRKVACTRSG